MRVEGIKTRHIAFVVLAVLFSWPVGALAQSDDQRAQHHFQAGRSYFDQGRYDDAIREWETSYDLSRRRHVLLVNIANAQERALRPREAIATLERYLRDGGSEAEANRQTVESRIQQLRQVAARLEGGQDPGPTDPGPTDPGPTDPGPTDPGPTDPGPTDPGPTDPGPTDPGDTDPGDTDPGDTDPGDTDPDPGDTDPGDIDPGDIDPGDTVPGGPGPEPEGPRWVVSWVTLGLTVALGAVTIGTGVTAMGIWNELEAHCNGNQCPPCAEGDNDCPTEADKNRGDTLSTVTDIFLGITAAAGIATVILFILEPRLRQRQQDSALSIAPWVAQDGAGLGAAFRF